MEYKWYYKDTSPLSILLTFLVGDVCAGGPDEECPLRTLVGSPLYLGYEGRGHGLVVTPHSDLPLPLVLAGLGALGLPPGGGQGDRAVGLRLSSIFQNLDLVIRVHHDVKIVLNYLKEI